ncbi:MAG: hypothetical protein ALECFALPRED_004026 [Alectoria fallacina]|uniref:Uncharacterized protein n=1 Tax=Alectoria fallacina TaxID=1903189 RepID=A0A8H3IBW6_9LECA|nr:MAG: hypothetical protein ALECFALPRED_004026 [Alectoria fallacina]
MEETVGIIAACIPTLKPLFTDFSTRKEKAKPLRSRYTLRQSLKYRLSPSHPTLDPYPIESAFHSSAENIVTSSEDIGPPNASSELCNASMENGVTVKEPARFDLIARGEDLSRGSFTRMMYSPEDQVVASQV